MARVHSQDLRRQAHGITCGGRAGIFGRANRAIRWTRSVMSMWRLCLVWSKQQGLARRLRSPRVFLLSAVYRLRSHV
jgi:hypothetical protein